jgi:hypothetical protein
MITIELKVISNADGSVRLSGRGGGAGTALEIRFGQAVIQGATKAAEAFAKAQGWANPTVNCTEVITEPTQSQA